MRTRLPRRSSLAAPTRPGSPAASVPLSGAAVLLRTGLGFVLIVALLAGCGRDDTRSAPLQRDVAARPDLSKATQADLAREVDEAERRGTWREVRDRWIGQHLHWTVTRHKALCDAETACNVAPFPIQRPAHYGWMPGVKFAPGEFAKLTAACGNAAVCEVELDGTLGELVLSAEQPVSLQFKNVRVLRATTSVRS